MGILLFIIGTVLGSFYLVIGTRLPLKDNIITGRSRCDYCKEKLKWYELIPIVSYVIQCGKCRHCHKKIKIEHLLIEIITGLFFLFGYLYFGITVKLGIYLVILSLALVICISDFKYMIILDSPLIISGILLLVLKYFEVGLKNTFIAIIYGIILFIFMYLIKLLGDKLFKRESLGGGDIKLSFIIGLTLGYYGIGFRMGLICIIFSAFLALPYALASTYLNKKNELPYGPFLIFSLVIIFIFLEKFTNLLIFFSPIG